MIFKRGKIRIRKIGNTAGLRCIDEEYKSYRKTEVVPYAKDTSYVEVCEKILPDKIAPWSHRIHVVVTNHMTKIGTDELCCQALKYMQQKTADHDIDIISIIAGLEEESLALVIIFRSYDDDDNELKLNDIFDYLGEMAYHKTQNNITFDKLIIPQEAIITHTEEEKELYQKKVSLQRDILNAATVDKPFLNSIDQYTPVLLENIDPRQELQYDLLTRDMRISTILSYEDFIDIFRSCMTYITRVEKDSYFGAVKGDVEMSVFEAMLDSYVDRTYIAQGYLPVEDYHELKTRIMNALFGLYIIGDLIKDPDITDIKITAPDSIRVRVHGKAYISNVSFIDRADYDRFIMALSLRNNIDLGVPTQTFTDDTNENYILRYTITSPYIMSSGCPAIHIRKVSRKKLMSDDLIKAGMMDEKIRDYLIDCGKNSRGVVFAGPPGSGKTIMLNWFLEDAYESSAEILVIQENDELFTNRKGVIFEHVVNNPQKGEKACSLEDLGRIALVAGANVFIIGEAKGPEICSAITLSNSGCRTAITIHSPSSTETIDKMADLAIRGYAESYDQAKRMMKSFETIVYLKDFKVMEISQIIGYDEEKRDIKYRYIYRRQ